MSLPSLPPDSDSSPSSFARLIRTTLSYDTNVMLAAIISLLLVILFVLLLHLYTRWFLVQARRRSRSSVTVPRVLGSRLHHRFTIIDTAGAGNSSGKLGLPLSIISSLPLFVYKLSSDEGGDYGLECAICLSVFEEEEIGRKLPGCGHAYHVECIDMWLNSHSTCPICRAAIQCNQSRKIDQPEIEIADPGHDSDVGTISIDEELRSEIVITISTDQISEHHETADVMAEKDSEVGGSSSSSIGGSVKKLLNSSSNCSNRSGGKIHPSSNDNADESEV